jgi:hypothetical protein
MSSRRRAASPSLVTRSLARRCVGRLFLSGLLDTLRAGIERSLALSDGLCQLLTLLLLCVSLASLSRCFSFWWWRLALVVVWASGYEMQGGTHQQRAWPCRRGLPRRVRQPSSSAACCGWGLYRLWYSVSLDPASVCAKLWRLPPCPEGILKRSVVLLVQCSVCS